jgi:hypothetical protein
MTSYPREELTREVAFIAYHLHWSLDSILDLDHQTRREFIHEISEINRIINTRRQEADSPVLGRRSESN